VRRSCAGCPAGGGRSLAGGAVRCDEPRVGLAHGVLGAPRCTPYYLAPMTRMTRFRERAPVGLRALGKLSSIAPREWGQCVEWVRWGAEVGREAKGDATVHFSGFFLSLSGGRQRRRRIQLSRS